MIGVSIIIPTYQRCNSLKRVLTSLTTQTFPHNAYDVIVSIDGSEDGSREMVENFKSPYQLRYIWATNSGRASACNRGIRQAMGQVVLILDDDMEPSPSLVEAHYSVHSIRTKVGVIGAAPIKVDESSTPITRYIASEFNSRLLKMADPNYHFKLWDFYGGNFSIRRETLLEAGEFNNMFKIYGYEDIELAYRLLKSGVSIVFDPDAICTQNYEENFIGLARKTITSGKTSVFVVSMHPETFYELKLREYNQAGWKWRSLRSFLIWFSTIIPKTPAVIAYLINIIVNSAKRKVIDKICFLGLEYFFWLGALNEIKSDKKYKQLELRMKSYKLHDYNSKYVF